MKRLYRLVMICAALLLLFPALASAEAAADPLKTMMQSYQNVVLGNSGYCQGGRYQSDGCDEYTSLRDWFTPFYRANNMAFSRFCITDLDADGYPEVILEIADSEGYPFDYELLRYENGVVYGFAFGIRGMQQITLSGDVETSDGASDNGWYTLTFSGSDFSYVETCRMQSTNGYEQYFIGDSEVTRSEYMAFTDEIQSRQEPTWFAYSDDNFDAIVAKF